MPATKTANTIDDDILAQQRSKAGLVFREDVAPGMVCEMVLHGMLHSSYSEYQHIQIIDTYFGRTLVTDGKTQSAKFDEFAYHECLVHPAMMAVGRPVKTVFIGGGGELATAREVLR